MQMYTVADAQADWHWSQHLAWEGVGFIVLVVLAGLLSGLGDRGLIAAFIGAPLITLALVWKFTRGDRGKAIAERGRYYCKVCWQHFEGDALRQITQ